MAFCFPFWSRFAGCRPKLALAAAGGLCLFSIVLIAAEASASSAGLVAAEPTRPEFEPQSEDDDATSSPVGAHDEPRLIDLSRAVRLEARSGLNVVAQLFAEAPLVTVCSAIAAGTVDDPRESPGLQRVLAEILRFGGYQSATENYKALVHERGGRSEVEVFSDSTVYCTTLPSAEIELALWVTASRFSASALSAQNLKDAVAELGRLAEQRDAAVQEGRAPFRLRKMAFLGSPELGRSDIPNPYELEAISLQQVVAAHELNYVARRSAIAIVGGGDLQAAQHAANKYLGRMHEGTERTHYSSHLVAQHTMRFSMDEDRSAKVPAAWYGWVVPSAEQQVSVHAALSIALNEHKLATKLISGAGAAKRVSLQFFPEPSRLPTIARLEVVGRFNHSLGVIEKQLTEELRSLALAGPSEADITHYSTRLAAEQKSALVTDFDRAKLLSRGLVQGYTAQQLLAPLSLEYSPTVPGSDEIKRVAGMLLAESQRSVVEIYPKGWQDPWQSPMPLFHIVEKGQTLSSIASRYGTSVLVVTKMNGITQKQAIYPGDKLKVPRGKQRKERPARTHQVRRGETLSGIAVKFGVKVRDIAAANGMGARQSIRIGEELTIPWSSPDSGKDSKQIEAGKSGAIEQDGSKSMASAGRTHEVKAGETLSGIAKRYGLGAVALARANGISQKAMVQVGQVLAVPTPAPAGTPAPGPGQSTAAASYATYTVKSGDTLSGIAKKHGVSVAKLTGFNQLSRKATIRPGQTLKIPNRDP